MVDKTFVAQNFSKLSSSHVAVFECFAAVLAEFREQAREQADLAMAFYIPSTFIQSV